MVFAIRLSLGSCTRKRAASNPPPVFDGSHPEIESPVRRAIPPEDRAGTASVDRVFRVLSNHTPSSTRRHQTPVAQNFGPAGVPAGGSIRPNQAELGTPIQGKGPEWGPELTGRGRAPPEHRGQPGVPARRTGARSPGPVSSWRARTRSTRYASRPHGRSQSPRPSAPSTRRCQAPCCGRGSGSRRKPPPGSGKPSKPPDWPDPPAGTSRSRPKSWCCRGPCRTRCGGRGYG